MCQSIQFRKNLILKRILFLVMLLSTFYIIFHFSAQDGTSSGNLSRKVTQMIVELFSKVKNMDMSLQLHYIELLHPMIRKLAHFSIYAVVGFSIMGLMCTFNMKTMLKLMTSMVIGVTYAIADEIHQGFTPGRAPSLIDVGIDSAGVLTGIIFLIIFILLTHRLANWIKG